MAIFGQPNKAGKLRRDTLGEAPRGIEIAQTRRAEPQIVHGPEPVGARFAALLLGAVLPSSRASRGRDVHHNTGAGIVGRNAHRTGPLQNWHALTHPVANPSVRALGAQSGPSSQPGLPGTGSAVRPSTIHDQLLASSTFGTPW